MRTLSWYLEKYRQFQKDIPLCYRSSDKAWWNDRCLYLDEKYSDTKKYNHRMVLESEVVIEFDDDNQEKNLELIEKVRKKVLADGIKYSLWHSGNKSYHLHFFINTKNATNTRLLKKSVMRYYTDGLELLPDLQLAGNHMIRAEYGLHEKTGVKKNLITQSPGYPSLAELPLPVWERYKDEMTKVQKWRMSMSVKDLADSDMIKELLDTTNFNRLNDGRERIMFVLSNVLCSKYDKKELTQLLTDWYRYTEGKKLSRGQIKYKVDRAYRKPYSITERYIGELLDELKS